MNKAKLVILDCGAISKLCLSSGRARAMQELTRTTWQPANLDDNAFISALYSIFPYKTKPGTVLVDTDMHKVNKKGQEYGRHYLSVFYQKLSDSPTFASAYAEHLQKMRRDSEEFVYQQFADARRLNREIENEWTKHIIGIKAAKTASDITVSIGAPGIGAIQGAIVAGIELAYASSLREGGIICGKWATKESLDQALDIGVKAYHKTGIIAWETALESNNQAAKLAESMARKTSNRKLAKLGRQLNQAQSSAAASAELSTNALKTSKTLHIGKKFGIPILFALPDLWDIYEEIETLH